VVVAARGVGVSGVGMGDAVSEVRSTQVRVGCRSHFVELPGPHWFMSWAIVGSGRYVGSVPRVRSVLSTLNSATGASTHAPELSPEDASG
jgi:hypothetical protein